MGEKYSLNNWLTFEEARRIVRDEHIQSVKLYKDWWDWHKPQQIPKYPYNVYKKQWQGWNDFLGNSNDFKNPHKRSYRSYGEAVAYVHKLGCKSRDDWLDHIREHGMPDDIPRRPELIYDTWVSWNHWLGNKPRQRVEAQQDIIQSEGLLFIVHMPGRPANVVRIGTIVGAAALADAQQKERFRVIKTFKLDPGYDWEAVALRHGTRYWENDKEWVVGNLNELVFAYSNDLLFA